MYIANADVFIDLLDVRLRKMRTVHFSCLTPAKIFAEVEVEEADEEAKWLWDEKVVALTL